MFNKLLFWWAIVGANLLAPTTVNSLQPTEATPSQEASEIVQKLLKELQSDKFKEREAAKRELAKLEDSRRHLLPLLRSADSDLAEHAKWILAEQTKRTCPAQLERFLAYGKRGEIERMVEGLAQWEGPVESEELWRGYLEIAAIIRKHSSLGESNTNEFVSTDWKNVDAMFRKAKRYPHYERLARPLEALPDVGWRISSDGHDLSADALDYSFVISTAAIHVRSRAVHSIIFTNGDVAMAERSAIERCLVVSAGKLSVGTHRDGRETTNSLIITRGPIDISNCGGRASCHFVSSAKIIGSSGNHVEADRKKPLDFIQWFTPAAVGLEVNVMDDCAMVQSVLDRSPAGRAGVQKGDIIMKIDDQAFTSAEAFRKQLLRGSCRDTCVLSINRGGKSLRLILDFRNRPE